MSQNPTVDERQRIDRSYYFETFGHMMTRTDEQGNVWNKSEAIDRKEVLRMFTVGAAEYLGRADRLGSLEPGKLADLVVLDRDYMAIPEKQFSQIKPTLTMVGGKVVYRSETPAPRP
jgi:predicted amidohydrolase YtcJ